MPRIVIISSSVRNKRNSHRVALYFKRFLEENRLATSDILDLNEYKFQLFDERLHYQKDPPASAIEFAEKIKFADGVLIITPEYNGGYPASLKNAIDLLVNEWQWKPVAISTVSEGNFGGSQVIQSLQFIFWKLHAWVATGAFPVPRVTETFDEKGNPADKSATDSRAAKFINELLRCIEAKGRIEL